ncbi:MAG: GTP 3',8-cyclase MoaA [Xanthomonadales bacterium]|nr:GTP 3',8-cyclase MoaA [Xanthomonadales bacterium]
MVSGSPKYPRDTRGRSLRDLRISVIDRCNFRCPYCMPAELFTEDYQFIAKELRLSAEEIERLARVFVALGVEKLRITGGEPLLRPDIAEIVQRLSAIPGLADLALTTNAVLLAVQAEALASAGLQRITVSLDSVDEAVFARMSGGRADLGRVLEGIEAAAEAGLSPIKINAVVQRGVNDDGVLDLLEYFRGTGHIVRFIEYMDVGNRNGWLLDEVVPSGELVQRIGARWPISPVGAQYPGEVARRFVFDDGLGEIGFISSVTQPFCGGCNRARLSSDGVLYTCLFATRGTDLRTVLRSGAGSDELTDLVAALWRARDDRYSELRSQAAAQQDEADSKKVEMYRIGG